MIRTVLALAALCVPLASVASHAAPVSLTASYVLTIGRINVALVDVGLDDDGQRYALDLSANVTGFGSMVASGTARATAKGSSSGGSLASSTFDLETRANGEQFNVDVGYAGGNVTSFKVDPPVLDTPDRVPVERSHLTGVGDFLSAFVLKGTELDKGLCQRTFKVFTGVERFDLKMSYVNNDEATSPRTGYQGPLVLCSIDYRPISGHYTSSEITSYLADSSRILIWYMPLGDTGYFIPYRAILGTSVGDVSMVLVGTR